MSPNPPPEAVRMSGLDLRRRLVAPSAEAAPPAEAGQNFARTTPGPRPRQETALDIDLDPIAEMLPDLVQRQSAAPARGFEDSFSALERENAELRQIVEESRQLMADAGVLEEEAQVRDRQAGQEIDHLRTQVAELREQLGMLEGKIATGEAAKKTPQATELAEWSDELEKEQSRLTQERKRLDEDRKQLRDDEGHLEKQMCDMEVQMARERAMIARQEMDLRRLSTEIQHELEAIHRGDGQLRDQMARFQRRHQEVFNRAPGQPIPATSPDPARGSAHSQVGESRPTESVGGVMRRLFKPKG